MLPVRSGLPRCVGQSASAEVVASISAAASSTCAGVFFGARSRTPLTSMPGFSPKWRSSRSHSGAGDFNHLDGLKDGGVITGHRQDVLIFGLSPTVNQQVAKISVVLAKEDAVQQALH